MRTVEVHWIDAEACVGWDDADEQMVPPKLVKSIGYYAGEDDFFLYLHGDTDGENTNRRMKIPWCTIKEVIELPPIKPLE